MTQRKRVRIFHDDDPQNPRDCESPIRLLCWHSRYNLGDDHSYDSDTVLEELACEHRNDLEELIDHLRNEVWDTFYSCAIDDLGYDRANASAYADRKVDARIEALVSEALDNGYVIKPIFMYEHSGVALNTGGFSCPWDSGQVGFAVVDKATVDREWGGSTEDAERYIDSDVEVYSNYVNGDVYGYIVEVAECDDEDANDDELDWQFEDSCSGFYGHDFRNNGIGESIGEELLEMANNATVEYSR